MKYKINLMIIVFGLFLLNSCNDENNAIYPVKMEVDNGIKSFDNYQELIDELETVNTMTLEELVDYESIQNYNSFGKISDLLYYDFIEDTTLTINEISDFIKNNPKYVELVIETDTTFVPTYDNSLLRYIMNDDRIFKVQDTLFKVFKTGMLSTLSSNYDDLLIIEEKDLDKIDTSIFSFSPTTSAKLSNPERRFSSVNREGIKFYLEYLVLNHQYINSTQIFENFILGSVVRGQRKFACWWNVSRTISTNYSFTIAFNGNNPIIYSDYIIGTSPSFKREKLFLDGQQIVSQYRNSVFTNLTGSVRQPNVILYF